MNIRQEHNLELISRPAKAPARQTPLLFVHGAYTGAWCWEEHFLDYFAARGYASYALSLSGHGGSPDRSHLHLYSIENYVADVVAVFASLPTPPVLIGHSMGGLVVQKFLERTDAPAAVLLASVPPQGLLGSAIGLAMRKPGLMNDFNSLMGGGVVGAEGLREALFHQPVEEESLQRYLRASQPESHRAIWDMSLFNLPNPYRMRAVPMLVLGAEHDHLIPPALVDLTARTYNLSADILPDLGHGMMLEQGWEDVAARIAVWLDSNVV